MTQPSPSHDPVLVERDHDIVTLTLHNPGKLNAFSAAMRDKLIALFTELNADPEVRAIVLTGHGNAFSAGADMGGWNETTIQQCRTRLKRGGLPLMREMIGGSKPIIAAVEGYAYGAGLALSSACDHIVASSSAKFCCAFTRVGFIPDLALMFSLRNRVGSTRAKQLIALAEDLPAERCEKLGLVDTLCAPGEALATARALARQYADGPPLAFELVKSVYARGMEEMMQAELDLQPYVWLSEDHKEGKQAFAERRKPRFTGR